MRMIGRMLLGLVLAGWLGAQTPAPENPPREKRIFQVKYADVRDLASVLAIFGYRVDSNVDLRVLTVNAPHDVVMAMEDALKRLDVPTAAPNDIDLTVYLVVASQQGDGSGGIPADLQPVANELKSILSFKRFKMLDTILLRTQPNNRASANGIIGETDKTLYDFHVKPSAVTEDSRGRLIRLNDLRLHLRVPGNMDAEINTEITVREGQKVVVGKSNMGGTDQALILVVTARVTE